LVAIVLLNGARGVAVADATSKLAGKSWYCAASDAEGSRIVLTGGPSQSAPALSSTRSADNILITWPASFNGFVLQQNADLSGMNWVNVTNQVEILDTQNEVVLPSLDDRNFFRLITN
jgi:hypothetical protein